MHASGIADGTIAVPDFEHFDASSGSSLERLIFNHRPWVLLACALLTAFFAAQLRGLEISANFENTLPQSHPYIRNYLDNKGQLRGLGDSVRIVVENPNGDIFDRGYLGVLKKINDELFLLPGVDRAWMKSIWAPVVRWTEVTEEGFVGGPVMPQTFDGGAESIEALRLNVTRAGVIGSLVANDYRSSAIVVPLLTKDAKGRPLDYHQLASSLEAIRQKHEPRASTTAMRNGDGYRAAGSRPHRRLCQARRRPDRRRAEGHGIFRRCRRHCGRHSFRLHALLAQHGAGAGVLAHCRGMAARPGRHARPCAEPRSRCWSRSWCLPSVSATGPRR